MGSEQNDPEGALNISMGYGRIVKLGHIYFATADWDGRRFVKIGYVASDPEKRVQCLQTGSPFPLSLFATFRGTRRDETALHRRLKAKRFKREWFSWDEEVEDFFEDLNEADIALATVDDSYDHELSECLALVDTVTASFTEESSP